MDYFQIMQYSQEQKTTYMTHRKQRQTDRSVRMQCVFFKAPMTEKPVNTGSIPSGRGFMTFLTIWPTHYYDSAISVKRFNVYMYPVTQW